ncbi:MAG: hypothetical protein KDE35_03455 [Geminicoccaceae bacterium]|nr:hypothetical protein [Geminicoccaceae bacterium]
MTGPASLPGVRRYRGIFRAVVAGLFASAVVVMGLPRLLGAVALLPGDAGYTLLREGGLPAPQAMERMLDSRQEAAAWLPDEGTIPFDLGFLDLSLAALVDRRSPDSIRLLESASDHMRRSIALRPGWPYAWSYLCAAELARGRPEEARLALHGSWRTGPYVPELASTRAEMAYSLWPRLDEQERDAAGADLAVVMNEQGPLFYELAVDRPAVHPLVRSAFAARPEVSARYEDLLAFRRAARSWGIPPRPPVVRLLPYLQ